MSQVGKIHDKNRDTKGREAVSLDYAFTEAGILYSKAKKQIEDTTGITFAFDESVVTQWGAPNGGSTVAQGLFTPSVQWKAFKDDTIGTGSFSFYFIATRYWTSATGLSQQASLNLNSPINDYPFNSLTYTQASYTHQLPNHHLAITVGQFPIANFDGNAYANNQQVNFLGYSLTQNGSQNYSQGSLGAYVQFDPIKELTFAGGFQDANNVTANYVQFNTLGSGQYAWFLYADWTPTFPKLGQGEYALLYYSLPSVPAQPLASYGLSFSASQSITDKYAVFLRANTAWNSSWYIQSSVAGGGVLNDPLGRNPLDQIGLGLAWNKTNLGLYPGTFVRQSETMLELYWATTLGSRVQLTPDVQVYFQPALAPTSGVAAVFSFRLAFLL
ncbi:MAG: carbohydrate porin [Alphaproteobacteria bacterium]|nr:carbohydrate porin [Alphaproteobacteria bacterium]